MYIKRLTNKKYNSAKKHKNYRYSRSKKYIRSKKYKHIISKNNKKYNKSKNKNKYKVNIKSKKVNKYRGGTFRSFTELGKLMLKPTHMPKRFNSLTSKLRPNLLGNVRQLRKTFTEKVNRYKNLLIRPVYNWRNLSNISLNKFIQELSKNFYTNETQNRITHGHIGRLSFIVSGITISLIGEILSVKLSEIETSKFQNSLQFVLMYGFILTNLENLIILSEKPKYKSIREQILRSNTDCDQICQTEIVYTILTDKNISNVSTFLEALNYFDNLSNPNPNPNPNPNSREQNKEPSLENHRELPSESNNYLLTVKELLTANIDILIGHEIIGIKETLNKCKETFKGKQIIEYFNLYIKEKFKGLIPQDIYNHLYIMYFGIHSIDYQSQVVKFDVSNDELRKLTNYY